MKHQQVIRPQWIDCGSSAIHIGPFWMGTPSQIEATQRAIDEECAFYEQASAHDDDEYHNEEEYDEIYPGF